MDKRLEIGLCGIKRGVVKTGINLDVRATNGLS